LTDHLRTGLVAGLLSLAALMSWACGQSAESGEQLYGSCAPCHGETGQGNVSLAAPAIAGLPQWYVALELEKFRSGLRGKHPDDVEGLRMRAMARQMMTDEEVKRVASYVAQFPHVVSDRTLVGADATAGQTAFVSCVACHGPRAEGNPDVKAPPLAGLNDWYLAEQLRKFRTGVRGSATGDDTGTQMKLMSQIIDEPMVGNVAAYLHGLPRQAAASR
jgi:cytochrome c553